MHLELAHDLDLANPPNPKNLVVGMACIDFRDERLLCLSDLTDNVSCYRSLPDLQRGEARVTAPLKFRPCCLWTRDKRDAEEIRGAHGTTVDVLVGGTQGRIVALRLPEDHDHMRDDDHVLEVSPEARQETSATTHTEPLAFTQLWEHGRNFSHDGGKDGKATFTGSLVSLPSMKQADVDLLDVRHGIVFAAMDRTVVLVSLASGHPLTFLPHASTGAAPSPTTEGQIFAMSTFPGGLLVMEEGRSADEFGDGALHVWTY